jgi:hypothetical protein
MSTPEQAPAIVRRTMIALAGIVLVGAAYLIAVRGNALMADLAALGTRVWCF